MNMSWVQFKKWLKLPTEVRRFDKALDELHNEFLIQVVPLGKAGSDNDFSEICRVFGDLVKKWSSWLLQKQQKGGE